MLLSVLFKTRKKVQYKPIQKVQSNPFDGEEWTYDTVNVSEVDFSEWVKAKVKQHELANARETV
jgi:hypothetical protein